MLTTSQRVSCTHWNCLLTPKSASVADTAVTEELTGSDSLTLALYDGCENTGALSLISKTVTATDADADGLALSLTVTVNVDTDDTAVARII